jgi:hypothetical protein
MGDDPMVGDVYLDSRGLRWIVQYDDKYFPAQYGGKFFLLYTHANMLSIGDRLPISKISNMNKIGKES